MKNQNGNIYFDTKPMILSHASVVGKKEGEGPLRDRFDRVIQDSYAGRDTFEQAESELMSVAVHLAMEKGDLRADDIDIAFCGDLLNQCVASSFAMAPVGIPYAGIYGACSTMGLGMIMSAIAVESESANRAVCAASSHYCTAERQYRFPLEYGSQRPPTAQWTVTGAGACIISHRCSEEKSTAQQNPRPNKKADSTTDDISKHPYIHAAHQTTADTSIHPSYINAAHQTTADTPIHPYIHAARIGRITDYAVTDQNNMGAAMAPAVVKIGTKSFQTVDERIFYML